MRTKISKSVGVMRRLFCQLPADVILKLYYSLVYSELTYALVAWGRSGCNNAAKIECVHRRASKFLADYYRNILTFHLIYDPFYLLKAFNTNTPNFHHKISKLLNQPSHVHNTRYGINSNFNTPLFNH